MTRRRWIADEFSEGAAALIGEHAAHLVRVLRARVGQEFDIIAGTAVRRGKITSIAENRVEFELGEQIPERASASLTLLLAIFKFDRMEWAIEKSTELGVARIIPVIARRSESHLASASAKRVERWRRLVVQASEQSRRTAPPEVAEPMKLREALTLPGAVRILLAESEPERTLRDVFAAHGNASDILMAIGPEGGWTEDELQLFQKEGWVSTSLGPAILRAETAAIAAIAIYLDLNR